MEANYVAKLWGQVLSAFGFVDQPLLLLLLLLLVQ